jgi:precorrin-2 dehydrogenase/sirohydrochlorin ferrochelatase
VPFDYPVYLDVAGADVLVVGGGRVALRKLEGLLAAGAAVTVVAPRVDADVAALDVAVVRREYAASDLVGRMLVITTTDDPAVNAAVAADARVAHVLVNSADDPANCSFILPAIARRGRMTVAVSSGGGSPALAQHVRDRVAAEVLTARLAAAADVLAAERDAIHAAGETTEGRDWGQRLAELLDDAATSGAPEPISDGDEADAAP